MEQNELRERFWNGDRDVQRCVWQEIDCAYHVLEAGALIPWTNVELASMTLRDIHRIALEALEQIERDRSEQ